MPNAQWGSGNCGDQETVKHALFLSDHMSNNFPRDEIANWWVSTMDPNQMSFTWNENLEVYGFILMGLKIIPFIAFQELNI